MLLDDFFSEYWPREETLEEVWGWVLGRTHGHLHLSGPAGCGKSWLIRGLAVGAQERGALPLFLEKNADESFTSLIWRLVDSTEFMLDIDGEGLRLAVSQALYEHNPTQALLAATQWLTQEVEGSFLILLDGFDETADLGPLPGWREFPEGVYLVTCGRARHSVDQLVLRPDHMRNLSELEGYLLKNLPEDEHEFIPEILRLTQGNWRQAYYYRVLLKLGGSHLAEPAELFEAILEALSDKLGAELFRTVHMDVLLMLAVAQVPVSLDLLHSWGGGSEKLGFALFELRELLTTDGEGSQYDALFTGEHYSLRSSDLRRYLLQNPAWRDRISESHRRAVARGLDSPAAIPSSGPVQDADFYSMAFAQYHLRESGRTGDLHRFIQNPESVERCWNLGRLAREQGYEEIGLQLFLVAAQLLEAREGSRSRRYVAQLAEIYTDCCHALTNQGRYSDGAHFGEQAVEILRPMAKGERSDPVEGLLTHTLLCLADPYLYMGYVQRAYPLYAEALERSRGEQDSSEQAKTIHALRGMARSSRALGHTEESLKHGQEALELARKLTRDEGEEWAQYLFELLMEQSETLRSVRETLVENPGPLEQMGLRWGGLRLLREAEELYHKFQWPGDQELVFLYLEQSMALFDLEKWGEAEERLSKAIEVINALPATDSHPADVASLEFLRSHALALMNRIGEASGSLANLLNPELMQEMDVSEQALVLFFRAKILSHQGLLRQAEAALEESIQAYTQTIGLGAEDLTLEQLSAKIYLARVRGRRGRLEEALELCRECQQQLLQLDSEEPPALELADVRELEGWILLQLERYDEALKACELAADNLQQIRGTDVEADLETEHTLNLVTRALIHSGQGDQQTGMQLAEQAVELELRRAQEGYEQARMWCALHRLSLSRIQRLAQKPQAALETSEQAWKDLDSLPANQKNHLGLHLAAVQTEIALAHIDLEQWNLVRQPLRLACSQYENEMWQSKEYLIAGLLDCYRHWLDFCFRSANMDWQERVCWNEFFEGWGRWQAQLREEGDNLFLQQAQQRLSDWILRLPKSVLEEWNKAAPQGLRRSQD